MYDETWLLKAIKNGENEVQDFKQTITSSEKIAKTLVAFSNLSGGRLIIGVKDNGVVSGVSVAEEAYMIQAAFERYSKNVLPLKNHIISFQKKKILVVEVAKNESQVALAYQSEKEKWLAYTRFKDQTVMVGFVGFLYLNEKSKPNTLSSFDDIEKKIANYISKNCSDRVISMNELKKNLQLNRKETITGLLNLLKLNVLRLDYTTDEEKFVWVE